MPKEKFICAGCGKEVWKYRSQTTNPDLVFCSLTCRNKNYYKVTDAKPYNYLGPVTKTCLHCGKEFTADRKANGNNRKYCSKRCSGSGYAHHPHSEETKRLISEKQKKYCEEHGNQFITGKSKGKHTQESITKMSESNAGKEPKWKGRVFVYDGPKGKFKMRSSYELAYATFLDEQNVEWEYEPHYRLSDGRLFSPDFKLSDGVIIEIKGFWSARGKEKWEKFCQDYPELEKLVLMKTDLQELGLEVL